jgi:hypothetical protein
MHLGKLGLGGTDWIDIADGRGQWMALVNSVMKLPVPCNSGNFLISYTTNSLSRRAHLTVSYCLCGPVVRVPGYRSRGPGSIPALPIF